MSKLEQMMRAQCDFQLRLDPNFLNKSLEERVAFIKEHSIHLNQEINEMLYELPFFKPWKDYSNMGEEAKLIAMQKARMECVDAWHFFMNIMIALGFTADEFFYMYTKKNEENHRRQDAGYTADKSYKDQSVDDVIKANTGHLPMCSVEFNGEKVTSSTFVTFVENADGGWDYVRNSSLYDMGVLLNILSYEYNKQLDKLPDATAAEVSEAVLRAYERFMEDNNE